MANPGFFGGIFEAFEQVRGFVQGIFGRGAREGYSPVEMEDFLALGGLEVYPTELAMDFEQHVLQTMFTEDIAAMPPERLVPGELHVQTERLLPHRFAYEVEIIQVDAEGKEHIHPYYVGSDVRLTQEEILEVADAEAQNSPAEGAVAYQVGPIVAAWARRS